MKTLKIFQKLKISKNTLAQDNSKESQKVQDSINLKDTHNTMQKGKEAEDYACKFLIEQGFEVLERNFHTRFGELDIIAQKDGILYFIEVKSGVGFEPVHNLNPAKLKKLTKTLNIYLDKHSIQIPYCLSALILFKPMPNDSFCVRWLENFTIF